jgi:hypothetical protein
MKPKISFSGPAKAELKNLYKTFFEIRFWVVELFWNASTNDP